MDLRKDGMDSVFAVGFGACDPDHQTQWHNRLLPNRFLSAPWPKCLQSSRAFLKMFSAALSAFYLGRGVDDFTLVPTGTCSWMRITLD